MFPKLYQQVLILSVVKVTVALEHGMLWEMSYPSNAQRGDMTLVLEQTLASAAVMGNASFTSIAFFPSPSKLLLSYSLLLHLAVL